MQPTQPIWKQLESDLSWGLLGRADFRYNLKRQCFYDVIRTQFQSKTKFYIKITEILKLHPIFVAIRHFRFRITK